MFLLVATSVECGFYSGLLQLSEIVELSACHTDKIVIKDDINKTKPKYQFIFQKICAAA